jgi:hypothetical protein
VAYDHSALRIISPFIKKATAERLLKAGKPGRIEVITRFNLADFCDGVSDTSALRLLLKHGAVIRGVRNLHAKLYLFGDRRAMLTSANLTEAAMLRNHEFGFVADEPGIIARCLEYFDGLWQQAGSNLTMARIDEWDRTIEPVLVRGGRQADVEALQDQGTPVMMAVPPLSGLPIQGDAPQAFVKFFGTGDKEGRVPRIRSVWDEVDRAGSHWACAYPSGKRRPRQVEDGAVMFMGRLVNDPVDTLIYGRAIAMQHVEGRDEATPADIARRKWKEGWGHYVRVHHAEFLDGTLGGGVSLGAMMDELKYFAFAPTFRNFQEGEGNLDPRASIKQKAAIELTPMAYHWINDRLEAAFRRHGKMSQRTLDQLDWPADLASLSPLGK